MKIDLTDIQNIIFDLGNVIVNLDFDATIEAFRQLGSGIDIMNHKMAYADSTFYDIEVGNITPDIFFDNVRKILNNQQISNQQINEAWCAMFLDTPKHRVEKIQELKEKHNLFVFSNTNQLHIDWFLKDFYRNHQIDFNSLFKQIFYSHNIHERKPDVNAFKKVIELSGVKPEETLFIDDLEKNIAGAKETGLKTFWLEEELDIVDLL